MNSAGFKHLEKNLGSQITLGLNKRIPLPYSHMKYLDDISLVQSINLKQSVVHPVTYHERTFNTSRKYDVMPQLTLPDMGAGDHLEVVETAKLLGVVVRSDTRWYYNTNFICKKGYQRLWMIRRLKNLGANNEELLDVYMKQVRSVLELAVPVW